MKRYAFVEDGLVVSVAEVMDDVYYDGQVIGGVEIYEVPAELGRDIIGYMRVENGFQASERPEGFYNWSQNQGWVLDREMEKNFAKASIDKAAGDARLRYITNVPGQQGVYLEKMHQAKQLLGGQIEQAEAPYIIAEASARDISVHEAALLIAQISSIWNEVLSPEIERLRIRGKVEVDGLSEDCAREEIVGVMNQYVDAIEAI